MDSISKVVNFSIKSATRLLCHINDDELLKIPKNGPLILVSNHINFLDVPVMYTHLSPRPMTGFAKIETWDNPILGKLFDIWGAIPLHRGEVDLTALRSALIALESGMIVGVAPEGTRSGSGVLNKAHPGVVTIAFRSGAPLLPVGFYGGEKLRSNLIQLRKTNFCINVGTPFILKPAGFKITRGVRRQIIDEIMYQIAKLLPAQYRGYYGDLDKATTNYLSFVHPSKPGII